MKLGSIKTNWMKHNIWIMALMVLILASCTTKEEKAKQEALAIYNESMKIHDEIMPRMDQLYKLGLQLKKVQDSLRVDSVANAAAILQAKDKMVALKAATKHMMDWMHQIKDVPGAESHANHGAAADEQPTTVEEIIQVQRDQKTDIEKVKQEIEKAIEEAKSLVKK